jgi:CheY-like chemotaxis protein
MDIRLHGAMDGIDAAQQIRARAPIPVIFLSAYTDERTVARAWETAPVDYLIKPVPDRSLRAALARALDCPAG